MEVIAITNQKGGVGKSTTAASVGAGLRKHKKKVLFIDMDAQGNLTSIFPISEDLTRHANTLDVLLQNASINDAIVTTDDGDIIPAIPMLASSDMIITATGKEYRLKEAIDKLEKQYDYVIIDTPPALGVLTINALTASNSVIIPSQPDVFSLQGIEQLYQTIGTVRQYCNPSLRIRGILLTRYNKRLSLSKDVVKAVDKQAANIQTKLYKTKIRECIALKEAQASKKSIFDYAPRSNAAIDYMNLVEEIMKE